MTPARWWFRLVDVLVVPAIIVLLALEPNAAHGFVDYFEAGQYLGPINRLLHGGVLYRDAPVFFGPLFYYVPLAAMKVFGASLAVLRLHFEALAILSIITAYGVAWLVCRDRFFRCLVPFLMLVEAYHPFWMMRWGGFRAGWAMLALAFMIRALRQGRPRDVLIAGAVSGVGLAYSLDVGIGLGITAVGVGAWSWMAKVASLRCVTAALMLYVAGYAVAFAPFLVHFALQNALGDYLHVAFWLLPSHRQAWAQTYTPPSLLALVQVVPLPRLFTSYVFKLYAPALVYAGLLAAIAWTALRRRATAAFADLVPLAVYGTIAYASAFRAVHGPQFQMALPMLIILGAALLERGYHVVADGPGRWTDVRIGSRCAAAALLALFLAGAFIVTSEKRYYGSLWGWVVYQTRKADLAPFYAGPAAPPAHTLTRLAIERGGGSRVPPLQAVEIDAVTRFLLTHTRPGEVVFGFPEYAAFNFFADRPALGPFDIPGFAAAIPVWRRELLQTLEASPPRIVVMGRGVSTLARPITGTDELLPEVQAYLLRHYRPVQVFSRVMVMERIH
jgi:hypothetical protein